MDAYSATLSVPDECSDAGRAGGCDVSETCAKANPARNGTAKLSGRYIECENMFKSPRKKRCRTNDRRNSAETRQARISEAEGLRLAGDYEKRRTCLSQDGVACFPRGDTAHFTKDCQVYLSKQSEFKVDPQ